MRVLAIPGVIILSALLLVACAPTTTGPGISEEQARIEARKQREAALRDYVDHLRRLDRVGFPVLAANAPLCEETSPGYGFRALVKSAAPEDWRNAVTRVYGIGQRPTVLTVTSGGPAEKAGLKTGDVIRSFDGWKVGTGREGLQALIERMQAEREGGAELRVRRHGDPVTLRLAPRTVCDYALALHPADEVNAFADGDRVVVTTGMMRFLEADRELALVVGHELAHNTRGHIGKKTGNVILGALLGGIVTGLTGVNVTQAGAQAGSQAFSQAFEQEADYVGAYHAARAGFDVRQAARLWRRMARTHPQAIGLEGSTHPSTAKRFLAIEEAAEEIREKQREDRPLVPSDPPGEGGSDRSADEPGDKVL